MSEYFNPNYSPNDRPNFDLTNTLNMEIKIIMLISVKKQVKGIQKM